MSKYIVDPEWAEDQLRQAGFTGKDASGRALRESVMLLILQFNAIDEDAAHKMQALEFFGKLAQRHELVGRDVMTPGARWRPFDLGGDVRPGATVRVRENAYEGAAGDRHNGKVGKFVAARGGSVIVQYAGSAEGTGHRHTPDKLEALSA